MYMYMYMSIIKYIFILSICVSFNNILIFKFILDKSGKTFLHLVFSKPKAYGYPLVSSFSPRHWVGMG